LSIRIEGFKTVIRKDGKREDWVAFTSRDALNETGNISHLTWERVNALRPPEEETERIAGDFYMALVAQWSIIGPAYQRWLEGNEIPEQGTPLAAWHGVQAEQASALRGVGIRTVEDLANATEGQLSKAPIPHMRKLKEAAKAFLDNADTARLDDEVARLRDQNAAMLEAMERMAAELAARDRGEAGPGDGAAPRRGRPPKAA
jgi:hypothetical protein